MRFQVLRRFGSGYEHVSIPGMCDALVMHGTREQVLHNLRSMGVGLVGIKLVRIDEDDRPIAEVAS